MRCYIRLSASYFMSGSFASVLLASFCFHYCLAYTNEAVFEFSRPNRNLHMTTDRSYTELYTDVGFPNPFKNPTGCKREGLTHSWICDPDGMLSDAGAEILEGRLLRLRDTARHVCSDKKKHMYQVAVVVVNRLQAASGETDEGAVHRLAGALLRRWGVGNRECHDGMLMLYNATTQTLSFQTREGVEPTHVSEDFKRRLEHDTVERIMRTSIDEGLAHAVTSLNEELHTASEGMDYMTIFLISSAIFYLVTIVAAYAIVKIALLRKYQEDVED